MFAQIMGKPIRSAAIALSLVVLVCVGILMLEGCAGVTVPDIVDMLVTPTPSETGPVEPTQPAKPTFTPAPTPQVKPTMPPLKTPGVKPTPEPTPEKSMKVCVSGIPKMTEENKDQINKQLLFCCYAGDQAVGIYHRYLQPDWPVGKWWPTWRIEVWSAGKQVGEWDVQKSHDLPAENAEFLIDYSGSIEVTCLTTGDSQQLDWKMPAGKTLQLGEDEYCGAWGWHSKAVPRLCK